MDKKGIIVVSKGHKGLTEFLCCFVYLNFGEYFFLAFRYYYLPLDNNDSIFRSLQKKKNKIGKQNHKNVCIADIPTFVYWTRTIVPAAEHG